MLPVDISGDLCNRSLRIVISLKVLFFPFFLKKKEKEKNTISYVSFPFSDNRVQILYLVPVAAFSGLLVSSFFPHYTFQNV
jgi:hypothetical protein